MTEIMNDDHTPLVSVTMPTYNRAAHLPGAIKSILGQTFTDFEFIIIDDGSTDNTAEVVARYKDPRIIYVRNDTNRGVSYSANRGIEMARGKYIARADSDDINLPDRLAKTVAFMEAHPDVGIVGGQVIAVHGNERHPMQMPTTNDECRAMLLFHSCFMQPTILIRKEILDRHGLRYDLAYRATGDYEMWTRMMWVTKFANLDVVVVEYIWHGEQLSASWSNVTSEQRISPIIRVLNELHIADRSVAELLFLMSWLYRSIQPSDTDKALAMIHLLLQQNEKYRVFEQSALRRVLDRKWGLFCAHATRHGLPTFKAYWSADLSPEQRFSKMTAKILVKSILRHN